MCQYATSPGNSAHCYAELAVSSPSVAKTIANSHCTYPRTDGQVESACKIPGMVNPGTNGARLCRCGHRHYRYAKPATYVMTTIGNG